MSKHTTLPTVARVISDTYELPYAQAYAAAVTTAQQLGITTSKSPGCQGPLESARGRS